MRPDRYTVDDDGRGWRGGVGGGVQGLGRDAGGDRAGFGCVGGRGGEECAAVPGAAGG
nr:hypothetical protein [Burkholderia gladioli]